MKRMWLLGLVLAGCGSGGAKSGGPGSVPVRPAPSPSPSAAMVEAAPAEPPPVVTPPAVTPPAETPPAETPPAEAAAEEPAKPRKIVTETSITIIDFTYFRKNRSDLEASSHATLDAIAETLGNNPQIKKIALQGHADAKEKNPDTLSAARATAVRDYLVAKGVDAARLEVQAKGKSEPKSAGKSSAERAKNQRVEYIILEKD